MFRVLVRHTFKNRSLRSSSSASSTEQPWKDPWKHAVSKQSKCCSLFVLLFYISNYYFIFLDETYTDVEELKIDWKYVERLMPIETIPKVPHHEKYPTPSGWQPPRSNFNYVLIKFSLALAGELPYFVERRRDHLFPLYLERRRLVVIFDAYK